VVPKVTNGSWKTFFKKIGESRPEGIRHGPFFENIFFEKFEKSLPFFEKFEKNSKKIGFTN
jgi:hypothetical protein